MHKKSLVLLLVASSFASSVFATSFMNKLLSKHSSAILKNHKMTKQDNHPFTDFSGTWTGNCGDGQNITTVIENDANHITFDGTEYRIGQGLRGQSEANEEYVNAGHTSVEWNTDGSALTIKGVDLAKANADSSTIETDMSQFALTMKNGQINIDGKWIMFEDMTQSTQPVVLHCVFSKNK